MGPAEEKPLACLRSDINYDCEQLNYQPSDRNDKVPIDTGFLIEKPLPIHQTISLP